MKKTCKRLGAIFLAMAMAVSVLCTGAMAADNPSITIKNASAGHTYEAYQVFAGTLDSTGTKLGITDWGTGVNATELLNALQKADDNTSDGNATYENNPFGNKFVNATTAADVAAVVSTFTGDDANLAKEFAKVVAAHLSGTTTGTFTAGTADANGKVTYTNTNVTVGYYLVKDKSDSTNIDAFTNYILKVVGAAEVEPKSAVPTVTKKIVEDPNGKKTETDATTANIGDNVNFKLTATLPDNYADYKNGYMLTFTDTLSKGLNYNGDVKVYVDNNGTETEIKSGFSVNPNAAVTTAPDTDTTITVKFDNLNAAKGENDAVLTIDKNSKIIVKYSATLNENAKLGTTDGGNSNKVKLEYSNNPNDTSKKGTTPEDEVKVYTFQMNVVKKDGDGENANALSGAKFVLATKQLTKTEDQTTTDVNVITTSDIETYKTNLVGVNGSSPTYTVGGTTYEMEVSNTEATKGQLNIKGLKAGTYYLYETVAPDGYNKLTKPIKIEITAGEDTKSVDGKEIKTLNGKVSAKVDDNTTIDEVENGILDKVTVVNNAGSQLPSTGGMGTTLFYVIGGVLMAGAAIVLVIKKKRSSAE